MKTIVRKASAADIKSINALFRKVVTAANREVYTTAQLEQFIAAYDEEKYWATQILHQHTLVASNMQNDIIGYLIMQQCCCIDMLCVQPELQNKGIGSRLLDAIYDLADGLHIQYISAVANVITAPFFEKNGFYTQEAKGYDIGGLHCTQIIFVKRLSVK